MSQRTTRGKPRKTHGLHGSRIYQTWADMLRRCNNPKRPSYHNYGGRGIRVCDRWAFFENFYADMGWQPYKQTLDRVDNDGNYEPSNCRWSTAKEQSHNTRKSIYVMFRGKRVNYLLVAIRYGLKPTTALARLRDGWDVERALTERVRVR